MSDDDFPPKLPWDTKKRKRWESDALPPLMGSFEQMWQMDEDTDTAANRVSEAQMQTLLDQLLLYTPATGSPHSALRGNGVVRSVDRIESETTSTRRLLPVEELFKLSKPDMMYIAQIVSEQAVSCMPHISQTLDIHSIGTQQGYSAFTAVKALADEALQQTLPSADVCDIARLALIKEPPNRNVSLSLIHI